MSDLDNRKLYSASVGSFGRTTLDDKPFITTRVDINLTSPDGSQMGPGIDVELGVPVEPTATLDEIHDQLVARAYEIIQRIAKEPLEVLQSETRKPPKFDFTKP